MPAINITDLNNAKTDVDHIAEIATSPALTATDRLGNTKRTMAGALDEYPNALANAAAALASSNASEVSRQASGVSAGLATTAKTAAEAARDAAQLIQLVGGAIGKTTLALLNADLARAADTLAVVTNDPTPANNTTYIKLGASGAGSWQVSTVSAVKQIGGVSTPYTNLLTGATYITGKVLNGAGAEVVSAPSQYTSNFIPVLPLTKYTNNFGISGPGTYYNAAFAVLGTGITGQTGAAWNDFTTPAGCAYVRLNLLTATAATAICVLATQRGLVNTFGLQKLRVSEEQVITDFLQEPVGIDLLAGATYVVGSYLNASNVVTTSAALKYTSNFIPVRASGVYLKSGATLISGLFYDAAQSPLNHLQAPDTGAPAFFTAPAGAAFVRLNVLVSEALPSFKRQAVEMPGLTVRSSQIIEQGALFRDVVRENGLDLLVGAAYASGFYLNSSGAEAAAVTFRYTTDYLPVTAGAVYTKSSAYLATGVYYDAAKAVLSGLTAPDTGAPATFTVPAGAAFVRLNVKIAEAAPTFKKQNVEFPWLVVRSNQIIDPVVSLWTGKKIAWYGTSISAGFPNQSNQTIYSFANKAVAAVGGTIQNYSVPNGVIRAAKAGGAAMSAGRGILSLSNLASAINYQNSILNLIGTASEPDYFVFNYDVNDADEDATDTNLFNKLDPFNVAMSIISRDKNTFIGANNWIIDQLRAAKPRARFAFVTHFSEDHQTGGYQRWRKILDALEALADSWGVPILKTYKSTGWIYRNGIDTLITYMTDRIHPATDSTGQAVDILASITTDWLRGIK